MLLEFPDHSLLLDSILLTHLKLVSHRAYLLINLSLFQDGLVFVRNRRFLLCDLLLQLVYLLQILLALRLEEVGQVVWLRGAWDYHGLLSHFLLRLH